MTEQGRIARGASGGAYTPAQGGSMNVPKISDFDFSITGKKIDDRPAAYVGDVLAKVVLPGTSEPEVVQTIGEVGPATVIPARDPNPRPAEPGSWPPDEADMQAQALANAARPAQFWSLKQAAPKPPKSQSLEIF
jgi:hypothetical protein